MRAKVGDRVVLTATKVDDPVRHGTIIGVGGDDGGPPFTVRWSDGRVALFFPGPGSVLSVGHPELGD